MKKRNLKSLNLNKESISSLKEQEAVNGGGSALCTGLAGSCWCDFPGKKITVTTCISGQWCE